MPLFLVFNAYNGLKRILTTFSFSSHFLGYNTRFFCLVVRPLKKHFFLCVSSLRQAVKNTPSNLDSPNLKKKVYVFFFLNCPYTPPPLAPLKNNFFMYPPTRGNLGLKRPGAIAQKNPFHAVSGHYRHYRLKKKVA